MTSLRPGPRLAVIMVGLPARGKSFIARKLARYLSWSGHPTQVFNVGSYRRRRYGSYQPHSFFDPDNAPRVAARHLVAMEALDDLLEFLDRGGDVAIYDATNHSRERRALVRLRCADRGVDVLFVESITDDPAVVEASIRANKARSPDYQGVSEDEAVQDFRMRIEHYRRGYTEVGEDEGPFVKIIDVGRRMVLHRIHGYLPSRVAGFLQSLRNIQPRTVWLTRHGESAFNVSGRIGGDASLSDAGRAYAERLAAMVAERTDPRLAVWTSTLRRTVETARIVGRPFRAWPALDEIDAGVCDGLTYAEIAERLPHEFASRAKDKYGYRYPGGESYRDVIRRLEPVIFELERERDPVLVIGHQAVSRALYAYLMDRPPHDCPHVSLPLHTICEIEVTAYGSEERRLDLGA